MVHKYRSEDSPRLQLDRDHQQAPLVRVARPTQHQASLTPIPPYSSAYGLLILSGNTAPRGSAKQEAQLCCQEFILFIRVVCNQRAMLMYDQYEGRVHIAHTNSIMRPANGCPTTPGIKCNNAKYRQSDPVIA